MINAGALSLSVGKSYAMPNNEIVEICMLRTLWNRIKARTVSINLLILVLKNLTGIHLQHI